MVKKTDIEIKMTEATIAPTHFQKQQWEKLWNDLLSEEQEGMMPEEEEVVSYKIQKRR